MGGVRLTNKPRQTIWFCFYILNIEGCDRVDTYAKGKVMKTTQYPALRTGSLTVIGDIQTSGFDTRKLYKNIFV
jgi:hypothetical protein